MTKKTFKAPNYAPYVGKRAAEGGVDTSQSKSSFDKFKDKLYERNGPKLCLYLRMYVMLTINPSIIPADESNQLKVKAEKEFSAYTGKRYLELKSAALTLFTELKQFECDSKEIQNPDQYILKALRDVSTTRELDAAKQYVTEINALTDFLPAGEKLSFSQEERAATAATINARFWAQRAQSAAAAAAAATPTPAAAKRT